jgi:hypothetical protein
MNQCNKFMKNKQKMKKKSTSNNQLSENAYYMCKLNKTLYGLEQAPRAWYSN